MAVPLSECDSFLNRVVMQAGAGFLGTEGGEGYLTSSHTGNAEVFWLTNADCGPDLKFKSHDVVGETAAPESPMRAPPRVIRLAGKRKLRWTVLVVGWRYNQFF